MEPEEREKILSEEGDYLGMQVKKRKVAKTKYIRKTSQRNENLEASEVKSEIYDPSNDWFSSIALIPTKLLITPFPAKPPLSFFSQPSCQESSILLVYGKALTHEYVLFITIYLIYSKQMQQI